jgi:hypothetical protein
MKTHLFSVLCAAVLAAFVAGIAGAATGGTHASLLIRHQVRGCHTWSANGGPFQANQAISLQQGGWLTVRNNDVMPHKLVLTAGPFAPVFSGRAAMAHMGALVKVTFTHPGTYRFATKAGEDYPSMSGMMKTVGEDKVLRLTVTVH